MRRKFKKKLCKFRGEIWLLKGGNWKIGFSENPSHTRILFDFLASLRGYWHIFLLDIHVSALKKVTPDMQTHKNPNLRSGPAPFKSSATNATNFNAKQAGHKPPVFSRDGKKWIIVSTSKVYIQRDQEGPTSFWIFHLFFYFYTTKKLKNYSQVESYLNTHPPPHPRSLQISQISCIN